MGSVRKAKKRLLKWDRYINRYLYIPGFVVPRGCARAEIREREEKLRLADERFQRDLPKFGDRSGQWDYEDSW